jgi:hypothetical protein
MPYVIQLASEYVVEIAHDAAEGIPKMDGPGLAAFARANPAYLATLQRRVISYWSCYHRSAYPDRGAYPGSKVVGHLLKSF